MTFEQDKEHRKRVTDANKKNSENERHAKKMLGILKKALRGGGAKTGGSKAITRSFRGATRGANSWKSESRTPPLLLKILAGGLNGDAYSEKQAGSQFVSSNMLGQTATDRMFEFAMDASQRPTVNIKNLFVHCSLSRPANEESRRDRSETRSERWQSNGRSLSKIWGRSVACWILNLP